MQRHGQVAEAVRAPGEELCILKMSLRYKRGRGCGHLSSENPAWLIRGLRHLPRKVLDKPVSQVENAEDPG